MRLSRIWDKVKEPLYVMLLWIMISFVWRTDDPDIIKWKYFIGSVISITVFAYIGFLALKEKKQMRTSFQYGAFVSVISAIAFTLTYILENILAIDRIELSAELMIASLGLDPNSARETAYMIILMLSLIVFITITAVGICITTITTFFFKKH